VRKPRRRAAGSEAALDRDRLLELSGLVARARVVVLGDVVLDRYWVGRSSRLSREAPVIILEFEEERGVPGGAANAAANVRSLGGRARLVGRAGSDPAGVTLRRVLRAHGLEARWIVRDAAIDTAVKTRVLAGSSHAARQQLVRLDRGRRVPVGPAAERALLARLRNALRGADALLLSDYGYGVLGPGVRARALRLARRRGLPEVAVDLGEQRSLGYYTGITFAGHAPGAGAAVASGGRYDGLLARFGRPDPAIGFAVDLEYATQALERQNGSPRRPRRKR